MSWQWRMSLTTRMTTLLRYALLAETLSLMIPSKFPMPCDYDGEGTQGTKFVFWL